MVKVKMKTWLLVEANAKERESFINKILNEICDKIDPYSSFLPAVISWYFLEAFFSLASIPKFVYAPEREALPALLPAPYVSFP